MNVSIHPLVDYFAEAPLLFLDAYEHSIVSALHSHTTIHSTNNSSSLIVTLSGSATVSVEGDEVQYKLCPGILLHQGANAKLQLTSCNQQPWSYIVLNYRNQLSSANGHEIDQQCFTINIGQITLELKQKLRLLLDLTKQLTPMSKLNSKAHFYAFIQAMLQARQQNSRSKYSELMLKAVEYMHHRYNKPISVTQISHLIGIERRRFAYLFERYTGMTPNHYLTSFRMKRSRELLKTQHYTVSQIAQLVGYHDSFYFSRVFKKYNGVSPSEYRKKYTYSYL